MKSPDNCRILSFLAILDFHVRGWIWSVNVVHWSESTTVFAHLSYGVMTNDVICIWRQLLSIPRQFSISEQFGGWQPCYQVSCNVRVPTNERWRCLDTPSPPSLPNTVNLPPGGQRWCWHVALLNVKTSTGVSLLSDWKQKPLPESLWRTETRQDEDKGCGNFLV